MSPTGMVLFFQEPRPKQTFPLLLSGLHSFLRLERAVRCPPQHGLMGLKSGNRSNCRIDVENPCRPSFPARFSPEGQEEVGFNEFSLAPSKSKSVQVLATLGAGAKED